MTCKFSFQKGISKNVANSYSRNGSYSCFSLKTRLLEEVKATANRFGVVIFMISVLEK